MEVRSATLRILHLDWKVPKLNAFPDTANQNLGIECHAFAGSAALENGYDPGQRIKSKTTHGILYYGIQRLEPAKKKGDVAGVIAQSGYAGVKDRLAAYERLGMLGCQ